MIMDMIENKENIRPFSLSDCKEGIKGKVFILRTFAYFLLYIYFIYTLNPLYIIFYE